MNGIIKIVDYDPKWANIYKFECESIMNTIGDFVKAIEHIGSTAVPSLAAKPIIDIMIGLHDLLDAGECIEPVIELGYEYVPEYENEMPERRFFRKDTDEIRSHHIHMVEYGSAFWHRHLAFRDILRSRPSVAKEYELLKRRLAEEFGDDRKAYTDAKTGFIQNALKQ